MQLMLKMPPRIAMLPALKGENIIIVIHSRLVWLSIYYLINFYDLEIITSLALAGD